MSVERIFVAGQGYANFDPAAPFVRDQNGIYVGDIRNLSVPTVGREITDVLRSLQRPTSDQVFDEFGSEVLTDCRESPSEDGSLGQLVPTLSNRWAKSCETATIPDVENSISPQAETTSQNRHLTSCLCEIIARWVKSPPVTEKPLFRTRIDWFSVSVEDDLDCIKMAVEFLLRRHGHVSFYEHDYGYNLFSNHIKFGVAGSKLGFILYGGKSQRGRAVVQFPGACCSYFCPHEAVSIFREFEKFRLLRVDIAADFYVGEVTVKDFLKAYKKGKFNGRGRPPKMKHIYSTCPTEGQTVYIGSRESRSFLRGYEKGKQQLGRHGEELFERLLDIRSIKNLHDNAPPGSSLVDWFRVELERKRDNECEIPEDIVEKRDEYFAGAYPFLAEILPVAEPMSFVSHPIEVEVSLEKLMLHLQKQYGKTLFSLAQHFGGSASTVWSRICGTEHSQRLIDAGLLIPEVVRAGQIRRISGCSAQEVMGQLPHV